MANPPEKKEKSKRNKTLDLPLEACPGALEKCLFPRRPLTAQEAEDRVLCGDFFTLAPLLPEKSYDLAVVDPPYNLRKDYGGEVFPKKNEADYAAFSRRWLAEVRRLLADTGSFYVCCDWRTGLVLGPLLAEYFTLRSRITWGREKGRGAAKNWKNSMEDIFFCTVGPDYTFHLDAVKQRRRVKAPYTENGQPKDWEKTEAGNFRDTCPSNFWDDITVPFWSMEENTAHPAQKPEKLLAKLILASSDPGGRVLDPFSGAGTAAVTAKKLGRRFTAVEKNELYCAWTQIRLERAETDKRIQGFENGVFIKK